MDFDDKDFKLADCFKPVLEEGTYRITGSQDVTSPVSEKFNATRDFYVAADTETLAAGELFSVYPIPEQQGDFSGTLPFIVLNNPAYPWIRHWTNDIGGVPVPWLALIVVAGNEGAEEADITYSQLLTLKEDGVFFPYSNNAAARCKDDDNIHILTLPKAVYHEVMPAAEDLPWLTHAKYVNLSAAEDSISEQDGWFSTIIANRFVPSGGESPVKSTIHLIAVDKYLDQSIPDNCEFVRFVSLYHWNVYSENAEDKSFAGLVNGLSRNSRSVEEKSLKPHYLRTGEKTYSLYHSPLLALHSARYENINGEGNYTADGRMIYDWETGIFDVSYAAAFNLGRLITLSRRSEAEEITAWRKRDAMKRHLCMLDSAVGLFAVDLKELCKRITEEKL